MRALLIFIALFLTACATPRTETWKVSGKDVTVHIDHTDNPCGTRGPWAGCSRLTDGRQEIWISGVAPAHIVKHELDHDKMRHSEWAQHRYFGNCAEILTDSPEYPKGGLICHNAGVRERVIPSGYLDN